MNYKYALILSGGGFKGAYQLGALEYIYQNWNAITGETGSPKFEIIAGVSVGALNGVMVAQHNNLIELTKLWDELKSKGSGIIYTSSLINPDGSITKNWLKWIGKGLGLLFGKKLYSLADNSNLHKLLLERVRVNNINDTVYMCGFVSGKSGNYYPVTNVDFGGNNENFVKAVLSSTTIPIIWRPIDSINFMLDGKNTTETFLFDGGLRNNSPINNVTDYIREKDKNVQDNYRLIIINCNNGKVDSYNKDDMDLLQSAKRAFLDIMMSEIFDSDMDMFKKINQLICKFSKPAVANKTTKTVVLTDKEIDKEKIYRYFEHVIIEPVENLGDMLDTRPEKIDDRRTKGNTDAKIAFDKMKWNICKPDAM